MCTILPSWLLIFYHVIYGRIFLLVRNDRRNTRITSKWKTKLALLTTTFFSRSGLLEWKAQSFDIFPPKTPILWFFYTVELHLWKHCAKSKQNVWHYFIDKWQIFRKICCVCLGLLVTKSPKLLPIEKICG